jgi:hypothetical protein
VPASFPDEDVRFARRLLERAIRAESSPGTPREEPAARGSGQKLVIGSRARWALLPSGKRVDLSSHLLLGNVLLALARASLRERGSGLSVEDLLREVWPDDGATGTSGYSRVKMTVSRLRARGLRDLIIRTNNGYALDADITVVMDGAMRPGDPTSAR